MTRTRKAAVTAVFTYAQFGLAIVTGIFLIPLTLRTLGARTWGLWLTGGELLGYAGMIDLGVLGVLPWMLAEADGKRDRTAMRRLLSDGFAVGAMVGLGYLVVSLALWRLLPSRLFLLASDRTVVAGPLALLVVATAVSYPLRAFRSVITGLQDVTFNGVLTIVSNALNVAITWVMLVQGYGLWALAWAAAAPQVLAVIVCALRTLMIAPDLMTHWTRPRWADGIRPLLFNGTGVWFGTFGWQLLAASNSIVITYLGHPEWVAVYDVTAKLAMMCMQLAWVLPDSALVGLAQLYGERASGPRVRVVVGLMLRLHLIVAGAAACGLLAFNPAFVTRWVGGPMFGGLSLNALLALGVVLYSLVHGLITSASVLGNRLHVGIITLVNGVLQVGAAIVLGHRMGLNGVALAGLIVGLLTAVPAGIVLLKPVAALTPRSLFVDLVRPWLVRIAPLAAVSAITGAMYGRLGLWGSTAAAAVVSLLYLWHMRPLYVGLPLDPRWTRWLIALRLLPTPAGMTPAAPVVAEP